MRTFESINFQPFILEAIKDKGFTEPTAVQVTNRFRKNPYVFAAINE